MEVKNCLISLYWQFITSCSMLIAILLRDKVGEQNVHRLFGGRNLKPVKYHEKLVTDRLEINCLHELFDTSNEWIDLKVFLEHLFCARYYTE